MFGNKHRKILEGMGYHTPSKLKSVADYSFPDVVMKRAKEELGITDVQMELVSMSLLDYFNTVKVYTTEGTSIEMTNKNADVLWHIFLLDTKSYMDFCANYIGFYIHHNPYMTDKMLSDTEMHTMVERFRKASLRDAKWNTKRESYYNTHRDTDDFMTYFPLYMMVSSCSSTQATSSDTTVSPSSSSSTTSESSCSSRSSCSSSSCSSRSSCSSSSCSSCGS